MDELYIIVRNWRRFQHYTDRNPPWIKVMTELLHDENYLSLPGDTRSILHGLWLEYASSNAQLTLNPRSISYRLRLRVTQPQLDRLEQLGWIEYALAPRLQDASSVLALARVKAEAEAEAEGGTSTVSSPKAVKEAKPLARANGKPPHDPSERPGENSEIQNVRDAIDEALRGALP